MQFNSTFLKKMNTKESFEVVEMFCMSPYQIYMILVKEYNSTFLSQHPKKKKKINFFENFLLFKFYLISLNDTEN